jgi:hypothetical protein
MIHAEAASIIKIVITGLHTFLKYWSHVGLVYHTSVDYEPHPFLPLAIHSILISLLLIATETRSVFNDVHTCEQINNNFINILLILYLV